MSVHIDTVRVCEYRARFFSVFACVLQAKLEAQEKKAGKKVMSLLRATEKTARLSKASPVPQSSQFPNAVVLARVFPRCRALKHGC